MLLVSNVFLICLTVLCKINENGAETQNLNSRERNTYENREVLKKLVELLNRSVRTNTNSDEAVIGILDGIDIRNSDEMKSVMKHLQKNYDYKEYITDAMRLNDARIHVIDNPEVLDDFVKELDRTESSTFTRTPGILESTVRRYGEFGLGKGGAISDETYDNRGSKRHKISNQRKDDDKTRFDSRERFDNQNNYKKKNYFDHRDNYDNYDKKNHFEAREKYSSYAKKSNSFEKGDRYSKKSNFDNVDSYNKKNNFEKRDTFDSYDKRNSFRNKERYENKEKYNIKEKYDSKPKYDNKEKYGNSHYSSSEKFNKREKYNSRDNFDSREKYGTKKRNSNQEKDKTSFRTNKNLSSRIRSRDDELDTPGLKIPDHNFEKPKVISFDLGKSDEYIKKKMDGPLRDNFYVSKKTTKEWRDSLERRKKPEKADNDNYNSRPVIRLPNKGLDWSEVGVEKKSTSKKYYEDDMPGNRGVMKPLKAFDWSEVGHEKSTPKKKYFDDDFTKRKENADEFTAQFVPAIMHKKTTDTTTSYSFSTRKQSDDWEQPALHYENKYKNNIEKLYQYDYSPKKRPVIRNDGYGFSFGRTPIPFVGKRGIYADN